ncbi:hypothetical protein Bpfe_017936 [Biomphalaria pfeifferi]|uniref:Uncharacterized protein n=1 Tax=Biomphalaria pfeifferi TaxID=112525 RepID=A0AAD8F5K9_BIOPF|nr:hypothetical protein Bpfe_017936 [Biomphalaria pfeifferi]
MLVIVIPICVVSVKDGCMTEICTSDEVQEVDTRRLLSPAVPCCPLLFHAIPCCPMLSPADPVVPAVPAVLMYCCIAALPYCCTAGLN